MVGTFGLKPKGTMQVRALPLAHALTERGHQVALFLPPWSYPSDAGRNWEDRGVRIENVPISPKWRIPFQLLARAKEYDPDVIHFFKPKGHSGIAAWLFWQMRRAGMTRARLVLDTDDWEGAGGWNDLEHYSIAQKNFFAWQEQWGLRHADSVTVASRALETIVWTTGRARNSVHYVPNGAGALPPGAETRESIRAQLKLGDAPTLLLYTRFVEFTVKRLGEIVARLFEEMPQVKLLVVGKGLHGEEIELEKLVQSRDWGRQVVYAGWVDPSQLSAYFAASDASIYPFDDTLVNRCKCAVKLVDLLSAGVPVVAEAVGQNCEYVSNNETGLLVPPGDNSQFASSVVRLLVDSDLRKRLGQCAAETMAREFSWRDLAARVELAYR